MLKRMLINRDPIIHDVRFKSSFLIYYHFVETVFSKILSNEEGLVILCRKNSDLGGERGKVRIATDFFGGHEIPGWEKLGIHALRAEPVQIIESPEHNSLIVMRKARQLTLVDDEIGINKGLVGLDDTSLLIMCVVDSAVAKSRLNLVFFNNLSGPRIVKLHVDLVLRHQSAFIHLDKIYGLFSKIQHKYMVPIFYHFINFFISYTQSSNLTQIVSLYCLNNVNDFIKQP